MLNDMMQKQGLTRSYALSLLRSKFESEERHQEVEYVEDLIRKEAEKQEQEFELPPTVTTATSTAAAEEEVVTTNQPGATISTSTNEVSKISYPPQQQKQEILSSKLISKQLDKQTIQINKKIIQVLQPLQKQSQLTRQLQSQLKQLQKQVSQIQRVVSVGKKNKKKM